MNDTIGVLVRPFPPEKIRQRPGHNGQQLSYIEGHEVIGRLIEAFGLTWSFRVLQHEIGNHEVIVLGELRIGETVKHAFGGSEITKSRDAGKSISVADDLKAASTDSLKKAATLLGVGLHLYGDQLVASNGNGSMSQTHNGNGTNGSRVTRKQLAYLHRLGQERGLDRADLEEMSRTGYGKTSAYLSTREASLFIDQLQGGAR